MIANDLIWDLLGSWSRELNTYSVIFRVALSFLLSAILGWERSVKRHSAGLRTFIIVSITGTIATMLDIRLMELFGVKLFLFSAAVIISVARTSRASIFFDSRKQVMGLTTSVALWSSSVIGMCVGAGLYTLGVVGFVALLLCLSLLPWLELYLKNRSNHFEVQLELQNPLNLQNFVATIRKLGLRIDTIEKNQAYENSGLSVYSIAITISSQELKKYKTHREIIQALSTIEYVYSITEI